MDDQPHHAPQKLVETVPESKPSNSSAMSQTSNDQERIRQVAKRLAAKNADNIRQVIQQHELERYQGDAVFCPVCDSGFSAFAPAYQWVLPNTASDKKCTIQHPEARCPQCQSLQRHRLLAWYLQHVIYPTNAPKVLLDIAPFVPLAEALHNRPESQYHAVDLNPGDEKFRNAPFAILQADLCALPFENDLFDLILCSHVLEHIPDDITALAEILRVLKPSGMAILQIPANNLIDITYEDQSITQPEAREAAFGQCDHVRIYGRDFPERLQKAGFKVNTAECRSLANDADIQRFGFDAHETLYLCTNPL